MNVRRAQSGFTVVELMIVVSIVGVIVAGVFFFGIRGFSYGGDGVKTEAETFARSMGESYTGINCVTYDSDGDGYVSCTIFRSGKDPLPIECARKWSRNSGCKLAMPQVRR